MPSRDITALEQSFESSVEAKTELEVEVSAAGAVTSVFTYP